MYHRYKQYTYSICYMYKTLLAQLRLTDPPRKAWWWISGAFMTTGGYFSWDPELLGAPQNNANIYGKN